MSMKMLEKVVTGPTFTKLVTSLDNFYAPLPNLPKGLVKFLVRIAPWAALLGGIFGSIGGLRLIFGADATLKLLQTFTNYDNTYFVLTGLVQLVASVLLLVAFKPLRAMKKLGWLIMFKAELVTVANFVINLFYGGEIVGSVVSVLIGFYIVFQVKNSYKN